MTWALYSRIVDDALGVAFYLAIVVVAVSCVLLAVDRRTRGAR
jgi:ABC-type Fe3+ transport system permease subunit